VGTGWNGNELGGDGWERKLNLWRWVEMGAIWATMQLCVYITFYQLSARRLGKTIAVALCVRFQSPFTMRTVTVVELDWYCCVCCSRVSNCGVVI